MTLITFFGAANQNLGFVKWFLCMQFDWPIMKITPKLRNRCYQSANCEQLRYFGRLWATCVWQKRVVPCPDRYIGLDTVRNGAKRVSKRPMPEFLSIKGVPCSHSAIHHFFSHPKMYMPWIYNGPRLTPFWMFKVFAKNRIKNCRAKRRKNCTKI